MRCGRIRSPGAGGEACLDGGLVCRLDKEMCGPFEVLRSVYGEPTGRDLHYLYTATSLYEAQDFNVLDCLKWSFLCPRRVVSERACTKGVETDLAECGMET